MKQLVVLVGLPGSGKAAVAREHADWVTVSREDVRRFVFRAIFDSEHEASVDRIFAAALVEAIDSDAPVVCVDDLHLTREARGSLLEVARISGRRPAAYVMPDEPIDVLLARMKSEREELRKTTPWLKVAELPRERLEALARLYQPVEETEGFARVVAVPRPETPQPERSPSRRPTSQRKERREPLPLFV